MTNDDRSKSHLIKVTFELPPGAWHGSATETLWAEPIGAEKYRLENSPFFALGVSYGDVVLATPTTKGAIFAETFTRGGHSTYRIVPRPDRAVEFETAWAPLQALGCTYEEGPNGLLAVDVPPETNIFEVYTALEAGESEGAWTFEEGHCGHAVG